MGVQRGGTTSLYNYLMDHPDIEKGLKKETYFFSDHFHRGFEWYQELFPEGISGEATPYYAIHPLVPARIRAMLPNVKLIMLLRDPVERAWSHYKYEVAQKCELLSFEEALDEEERRLRGEESKIKANPLYKSPNLFCHSYLKKGEYADQLERWYNVFPKEQILILKSEHLFGNYQKADSVYQMVLDFIGVKPYELKKHRRHNSTEHISDMNPLTRELLQAYYKPHNEQLYTLLGKDFQWNDQQQQKKSETTQSTRS